MKIGYYLEKSEQTRCIADFKKALQIITFPLLPVVIFLPI